VGRALLGAVAVALAVVAAGNAWVLHAASADILPGVADAPARPVAIVLGNRVFSNGSLSRELAARVQVSLDLYRAGKVRTIFVSGAWHPDVGYDEPGAMAEWLERRGVAPGALVLDRGGFRTRSTMADAAARGYHDVIVCTQRYHLPRALYLARHAGLNATGVVAADPIRNWMDQAHSFLREGLARVETLGEVALRGVRPSE
jgi:SanA protein